MIQNGGGESLRIGFPFGRARVYPYITPYLWLYNNFFYAVSIYMYKIFYLHLYGVFMYLVIWLCVCSFGKKYMPNIDFAHRKGYRFKDISFGDSGRSRLISGIHKLEGAVGSTLGPMGRTVIIESEHHVGGLTVTKDGITVAKSIFLGDAVENLGCMMVRQASERTSQDAGDGTSTAVVLARAIVDLGGGSSVDVLRNLIRIVREDVVEALLGMSLPLTDSRLRDVSVISCNNDNELGGVIADAYLAVGIDGVVTVESSDNNETYFEVTDGIRFKRGYSTPVFINSERKDECIMEDVYVLVSDVEISSYTQIEHILKMGVSGKRILLIAPCSKGMLATLALNKQKGIMQICAVQPPQFGWKKRELMGDIAVCTGAVYFCEDTGDDLSQLREESLGHCRKVIVSKDSTVIFRDDIDVSQRVEELKGQVADDKQFVLERIAALSGGIAQVYVGADSDIELKERKDRVDDAICAVRSALEEGIVPGGGVALYDVAMTMTKEGREYEILREALKSPLLKIMDNAGMTPTEWEGAGWGTNVKTGEVGNMVAMGIIDPLKVTRLAVLNAVSVAVTILGTNAIITDGENK